MKLIGLFVTLLLCGFLFVGAVSAEEVQLENGWYTLISEDNSSPFNYEFAESTSKPTNDYAVSTPVSTASSPAPLFAVLIGLGVSVALMRRV